VLNLVERDRTLGRHLVTGHASIEAEVAHAVEREMAVRVSDVMIRRLHLIHEDPGHGRATAPAVATLMGRLLGWDEARELEEVAEYYTQIGRARSFAKERARATP
jgi:glycerol-3-phosphate dehydrogenase